MKTGDYLGNPAAQQGYISTNYTFVARDMARAGHERDRPGRGRARRRRRPAAVAVEQPRRGDRSGRTLRAAGQPLLKVGVINQQDALHAQRRRGGAVGFFDMVVTDPAGTHTLFAPPNNKVSAADYAIGLHASSLVADGGTLQIGIGSLGDAIAQALIVRDRHGDEYRRILDSLCPDGLAGRETGPLRPGPVRLLGDVRQRLPQADRGRHHPPRGVRRRHAAAAAQPRPHRRRDGHARHAAGAAGRRAHPLARWRAEDLAFLQHFGVLRPTCA
jgi:hypothetical protein